MKPIACLSLFVLLFSFCPAVNDDASAWVEGKELAAVPASKETVDLLRENNVDIEHILEGKIRIWATPEELAMLKRRGLPYTVLHEEMRAERDLHNQWKARRDSTLRSLGADAAEPDYHSYNEMVAALQNLKNAYPGICRMVDVGDTVNGRDIWAVVISDNVNIEENEPEVRLLAGVHGHEWSAVEVTIDIAQYLCQNYSPGSGNDATFIVQNLETWIIPMLNADNHDSRIKENARGVNLNKNFDGPEGCSQGNPDCFSEPESQSMRDMFDVLGKRFSVGISYHSGAKCFNSVWNYDCVPPPDEELFWVGRTTCDNDSGIFDEIPAPNGLADAYDTADLPADWGWTNGAEWDVLAGDVTDYTYYFWGMLDTTIECTVPSTPNVSQIPTFLRWHRQATLNYLKKAVQGIHGLVTDAGTGRPLNAMIEIQGNSIPIFTDPDVGDYHRVLMPGTYTVIVSANGYATQTRSGIRVNANAKTTLNIQLANSGPDLVETSLSNPPASAAPGGTFSATDTVKNQGGGSAGGSTTRYYLSLDTVKGSGDVRLSGSRSVPALASGATSSGTVSVGIPSSIAGGSYYLLACADDLGAVSETNESNNCRASSGKVNIGPDLIISAFTGPSTAASGQTKTVSETTKNQGTATARASTTRFYWSVNSTWESTDVAIGTRSVPSLARGASSGPVSTSVTIPSGLAAGRYYLIARADAGGAVTESNETNNTRSIAVLVGPDLIVSAFTGPSTASPGQTVSVRDTTKNQGASSAGGSTTRFYWSVNSTWDSTDVVLGARSVPTLAAGASSGPVTTSVKVPSGAASRTYYIIARADASGAVAESSETNNTRSFSITIGP
jgi:hypothetical protein